MCACAVYCDRLPVDTGSALDCARALQAAITGAICDAHSARISGLPHASWRDGSVREGRDWSLVVSEWARSQWPFLPPSPINHSSTLYNVRWFDSEVDAKSATCCQQQQHLWKRNFWFELTIIILYRVTCIIMNDFECKNNYFSFVLKL